MRNALFIIGALLVVAGVLVASGMMKYQDKEQVEIGKLELEASREKTAPANWGWLLLGGGAVVLVAGALTKKV
jgi:hypothetical protein